ncbi:hypothetical protein QIH87_17840 [Bradyrhizobium elkanii]|uniref:hypothetical protein n=1 Tax=Bradyrhizobium elkanii TaxID=29448 RepID=UPI0027148891|nr:hypothetical protein [Bradyrhizobium elkanii]WLB14537.1 hypothetical protein QIH87_17840 [Bradyrhizobium elkanii]
MAESDVSLGIEPGALAERTAMRDQIGEPRDVGRLHRSVAQIDDACDAAHV